MKLTKNDLLVLGFLLERPMHGYEIGQELRDGGVELWFEISPAAVYYSLNKLNRLGLIAEAPSRSASSDRTVYHVTMVGREQFLADMERLLASQEPIRTEYDLGISLLNRLPRDQAESLLRQRVEFLRAWVADLEVRAAGAGAEPLQQAILRHAIAAGQLDIDWLTGIIEQLVAAEDCAPFTGDLMTLQGDLSESHLPDLIKLVASGRHSGTLVVTRGALSRTMTFDRGRLHCVGSQIEGHPVTDEARVVDEAHELFRWEEGTYVFDQRGCPREGCVIMERDADSLILEGARRLDAWSIIQRIVPASDALFERRDRATASQAVAADLAPDLGAAARDSLQLMGHEERVLATIDGTRDVTTVARLTGLTEFETSRILYGLYLIDLIQPADPDKRRLRRVFREFAELMCRGAIPFRASPEEASACEDEVNRRCSGLPVSVCDGRIDDQTGEDLTSDALATIYRQFLQTQHAVLGERLGKEVAAQLRHQVLSRLNPTLRETLERFKLL